MSASLVGSEMCIRDRDHEGPGDAAPAFDVRKSDALLAQMPRAVADGACSLRGDFTPRGCEPREARQKAKGFAVRSASRGHSQVRARVGGFLISRRA
eukprot:6072180-Alexandrium_andersonii.AAC.1